MPRSNGLFARMSLASRQVGSCALSAERECLVTYLQAACLRIASAHTGHRHGVDLYCKGIAPYRHLGRCCPSDSCSPRTPSHTLLFCVMVARTRGFCCVCFMARVPSMREPRISGDELFRRRLALVAAATMLQWAYSDWLVVGMMSLYDRCI